MQRDDVTRVEAHFAIGEVRAVGGSRAFSCLSDVKVGSSIVAKSSLLVFSNFIWNQTNGVNQKTHVKKVVVFFAEGKFQKVPHINMSGPLVNQSATQELLDFLK